MIEIPGAEAPLYGIKAEIDAALFEDHAVLIAENPQQNPALEVGAGRIPIDVEIGGKRRFFTPFEGIEPPGVVTTANRHVVRDDIENEPHAMRVKRRHQGLEFRLAAEFRIDPVMADDVVAMVRPRARLHNGRGVEMADAKLGE